MNNYLLNSIGSISINGNLAFVNLNSNLEKGIKKIDSFSHVHILFIDNNSLNKVIINITKVKDCSIVGTLSFMYQDGTYDLIDIKPYMPSEDYLDMNLSSRCEISNNIIKKETDYLIEPIGKCVKKGFGTSLSINQDITCLASRYLIIYWWFSLYDSKMYRSVLECNPPYENAPRSGVFLTRSPVRPNPIAFTVVKVDNYDYQNNLIYLHDIECFDETPIMMIQEYDSKIDSISECVLPKYLESWPKKIHFHTICKDSMVNDVSAYTLLDLVLKKHNKGPLSISKKNQLKYSGITVEGAYANNLKNIDAFIPYNKITSIIGVSGSGKSTFVNDIIYKDSARLSSILSFDSTSIEEVEAKSITGSIPSIYIHQKNFQAKSTSLVGTISKAYDYLRKLYCLCGEIHCDSCNRSIKKLTHDEMLSIINGLNISKIYTLEDIPINRDDIYKYDAIYVYYNDSKVLLQTTSKCYNCDKILFDLTPSTFSLLNKDSLCPKCLGRKEIIQLDINKIVENGELSLLDGACSFYGKLKDYLDSPSHNWMKGSVVALAKYYNEDISKPYNLLSKEFIQSFLYGTTFDVSLHLETRGKVIAITKKAEGLVNTINRLLKDNPTCPSLTKYLNKSYCTSCDGTGLANYARLVSINGISYGEVSKYSFDKIEKFVEDVYRGSSEFLEGGVKSIATSLLEITHASKSLGIDYLKLDQRVNTLSHGEAKRINILKCSKELSNVLYIFDEPSCGLSRYEYPLLNNLFHDLTNKNNTILLVEHNNEIIKNSDLIYELGPGSGANGGNIINKGDYELLRKTSTSICEYEKESMTRLIPLFDSKTFITLTSLSTYPLKNITFKFPTCSITSLCGRSGSGKSTLMKEIMNSDVTKKSFKKIILLSETKNIQNKKSIVATCTGLLDIIRELFAKTKKAKDMKLTISNFSFNSDGKCMKCKGDGSLDVPYFKDILIPCPDCGGNRYNKETLSVLYNGMSISDILNLEISKLPLYIDNPLALSVVSSLDSLGLGYLKLSQPTSSLSGGEYQRLRLAMTLLDNSSNNLYLLDEPTSGLNYLDIKKLLLVLSKVRINNTIIAIEHNKTFLDNSDYLVEIGPGSGANGGMIQYSKLNK